VIIVFSGLNWRQIFRSVDVQNKMPHPGWKRISIKTKPVYLDYAEPVNRHRLLGWAIETLSKLKSGTRFVRTAANKKKHENEIANADCRMTHSKKGKHVEELSKIETNDVHFRNCAFRNGKKGSAYGI
jgi:hypothetical protein